MRRTSILDGLNIVTLQNNLAALQQAYLTLSAGNKGESFAYAQGDGTKSVTYTKANLGDLTQTIISVQTQIDRLQGVRKNRRPAMRPFF
jgi:hypothetical protein